MTENMAFPRALFAEITKEAPAQPATNLWRAVELMALMDHALPRLTECRAILDLGCGDGGIMAVLSHHIPFKAKLIGIDSDPAETALAEKRGLYVQLITGSAEKTTLPDASVDAVISNSVLEHIEPIDDVLRECARVLRPGGAFIATVPGPHFHQCLCGPWLPWITRARYLRDLDQRLAHLRYWTGKEWQKHLADANIELTDAKGYLPLPVVRRWELLSRLTGGLLYSLAKQKLSPIRLQRRLGLRKPIPFPHLLIDSASRLLSYGLDGVPKAPYGCLLLMGLKK
jgi:ubiquinone/menaquinone biosynthesis C-methylase UbiE